ncbi:MAG: nucleotidyltransferase family protein [Eubacteriales bacterium]|nr:nucleotidyltransferase family protein [Eubacteriales bacterium]
MKIGMIMLAAGNSRRFGSNKLLYQVEGVPLYVRTLQRLMRAKERLENRKEELLAEGGLRKGEELCLSVTVVTQYQEIYEAAKRAGARAFYNPRPQDGISSSLKIGLKENLEADACLFAVSDQPWVREETLEALLRLFLISGKGMASLSHKGTPGNPCVFSSAYYPELMALLGDAGGKRVLMGHLEDADFLEVEEGQELTDLDVRPQEEAKNGLV